MTAEKNAYSISAAVLARRCCCGGSLSDSRCHYRFAGADADQPADGVAAARDFGPLAAVVRVRVWRRADVPRFPVDRATLLGARSGVFPRLVFRRDALQLARDFRAEREPAP